MKLPFVIIFDIDKTIIGDVAHAALEFDVIKYIYNECKKKNITAKCPEKTIDIQDALHNGLLRPHIKEFITFCNNKFKNVELFVYTNSSHGWTNNVIVNQIEKALKIKFNKPYFTREHSLPQYEKSLSNTYSDIMKTLSSKYPAINQAKHQKLVLDQRLLFIDDIPYNIYDYPSKQIKCPAYSYYAYYDIYDKIVNEYKISPKVFDDKALLEFIGRRDIPIYNVNGSIYQKDKTLVQYQHMYLKRKSDVSRTDDKFFKNLIKILQKIKVVDDKAIVKINKLLS